MVNKPKRPRRILKDGKAWWFSDQFKDKADAQKQATKIRKAGKHFVMLKQKRGWWGVYRRPKVVTDRAIRMRRKVAKDREKDLDKLRSMWLDEAERMGYDIPE